MSTGLGLGMGSGSGGIGGPGSVDNRNTGPHGQIKDVKEVTKVSTVVGETGMVFSAGETKGAPDAVGPSKVPYTTVLPDAKIAAENALSKDKVPPAFKKRVKDYFSSLE